MKKTNSSDEIAYWHLPKTSGFFANDSNISFIVGITDKCSFTIYKVINHL